MQVCCGTYCSLIILAILLPATPAVAQETLAQPKTVSLHHGGIVRGTRHQISLDGGQSEQVDVYLGIPFAKPPVGPRRFAAPEPHAGWDDTLNANVRPPVCWQYVINEGFDVQNAAARMWLNTTEMNEDCLYLNIWTPVVKATPNKDPKPLPVMVWIYGGGFTSGSSSLDVYDGSVLAVTQQVVVVSLQYRLGAFGFLRLDPKSGVDRQVRNGVPDVQTVGLGNQGILDQVLALEWVHNNVHGFRGDPQRVTVFGESSGAVSVSILWLSPLSQRLFQRIILQSGSVFSRWGLSDLDDAHKRGSEFAVASGCMMPNFNREASLKCLQGLDPITLVNGLDSLLGAIGKRRQRQLEAALPNRQSGGADSQQWSWTTSSRMYFEVPFKPVVDGYVLPDSPDRLLASSRHQVLRNRPDILVGTNKNEGMYFLLYGLSLTDTSFLNPDGRIELPATLRKAGLRQPIKLGGSRADFHLITAAKVIDEQYIIPGVSQLSAQFYNLPIETNTSDGYANPSKTRINGETLMRRLDAMTGDLDFACPTLKFADLVSQIPNSRVYVYNFLHQTASAPFPSWAGAMHGYEIEYVFGMPRWDPFQKSFYKFNKEERAISDEMMKMWGNFAKTGDPNINEDSSRNAVTWPLYKPAVDAAPEEPNYLILGSTFKPGVALKQHECRFWLHDLPSMLRSSVKQCNKDGKTNHATSWSPFSNLKFNFFAIVVVLLFSTN